MKKIQFLDGTMLKIIAMISMVCDHVGALLMWNNKIMRSIGRIAMPLFAFGVAEGYIHTKDKKKYLIRMIIFAFISEIPFNLFCDSWYFSLESQNIMFTFALAIIALMGYDKISDNKPFYMRILGVCWVILMGIIATLLRTDYGFFAVFLVFVYYYFRNNNIYVRDLAGTIFILLDRSEGIYVWTFLAGIPLLFYNGKKGKGLKWLFYVFYPAHLLIIYLIFAYVLPYIN